MEMQPPYLLWLVASMSMRANAQVHIGMEVVCTCSILRA